MALIGTISGSNGTSTTAISGSVIIADRPPGEFPSLPSNAKFYVSGTRDVNGPLGAIAIFGGDIFVTGGLGVSDYVQMLPVNELRIPTNTSASYIYTSGSTNDMYFTQYTGPYTNTTRLRWLESALSSGLLHGGILSTQNGTTTFSITSGSGLIVYQNATTSSDPYPTIRFVEWPAYVSQSLQYSGSAQITYVAIDPDGEIDQSPIAFNTEQFKDRIVLGRILHQSGSVSNGATNTPTTAYAVTQNTNDFVRAFGPLKISGHFLSASGSAPTMSIIKTAGSSYVEGRNYSVDPNNPNIVNANTDLDVTVSKIYREYVSGSTPIIDTGIANAGYTVLDPTLYNNNGTLAAVNNGEFTIQRVFWFPRAVNQALFVYYGSAKYATMDDAIAGIGTENFIEGGNTAGSAILVGYICLKGDASDLLTASQARVYQGGLFRGSAGASFGGAGGSSTLPGGLDTHVQFNDDNAFGGESGFTFNKLTNSATLVGDINAANANLSGNVNAAVASITGNAFTSGTLYAKDVSIFGNLTVTSGSTIISGSGDVSIQSETGSINIATAAVATPVNIANNTTAGTVNIGTGTATQTLNLGSGSGAKTVNVGSSTGASSLSLQAGTGALNIGTAVTNKVITIGQTANTSNLALNGGTGGITLTTTLTGGIQVGTDAGTGTISIGSSTGARQIDIGNGATSTGNINIAGSGATGARVVDLGTGGTGIKVVRIGNSSVAGSTTTITAGSTGGVNIGNSAIATPVTIASNTTAGTVSIGTGTATQTLNFGTGIGAKTVTLGSRNSTSTTLINAGTGGVTISSGSTTAASIGNDVFFYVSGNIATKPATSPNFAIRGTTVFGGDVVISGTLFGGSPLYIGDNVVIGTNQILGSSGGIAIAFTGSNVTIPNNLILSGNAYFGNGLTGSLTKLNDGSDYLRAGTNVQISTGSSGEITISVPGALGGDVVGPASATNDAIAVYDGTTGKLIKNSNLLVGTRTTTQAYVTASVNLTDYGLALIPNGTGSLSAQVPDGTSAGGNARGSRATDWQRTRTSAARVASGNNSTIGGGDDNLVDALGGTVAGGVTNAVSTARSYGTIGGGQSNTIFTSGTHGTIGGGQGNAVREAHAIVVGGLSNTASGPQSFIGGGTNNTASGTRSSVICGSGNVVSANNSIVGAGANNTIAGAEYVFVTSQNSSATGNYGGILGGFSSTSSAFGAITLGGQYGVADHHSEVAISPNRFTTNGDSQQSLVTWLRQTTTAATSELTLTGAAPGSGTRFTIASGAKYTVQLGIVASSTTGDTAWWQLAFGIKNVGGTTSLVGSVATVTSAADAGASTWTIAVVADDTNDSIQINVTGAASTTINWVASGHLTKVIS